MPKPQVVVQIGHEEPRDQSHPSSGAAGELALVRRIGAALVERLERDGRVDVKRIPGRFPAEISGGSWRVDAFIALHGDSVTDAAVEGYTFGFPPTSTVSKKFADLVAAQFSRFHRSHRRQDNVTGALKHYYGWDPRRMPTQAPRILVEHGFVSNPVEHQWLKEHVEELAEAEYHAILRLLDLDDQQPLPDHDADWVWFAEWSLWTLGRGQYAPYGKANARVRPRTAPTPIPRHASDILRDLQRRDDDTEAPVTPSSRLLTTPRADRDGIERYVVERDHAPHTDEVALEVAGHYFEVATAGGLDPTIAAAQMVLETDNLKSKWARTHKNLAGIGITRPDIPPEEVPRWDTWRDAVIGHVGRLLAYALPKETGTPQQKQLIQAALAKRGLRDELRGCAPTVDGLRNWAGDPQYVANLISLANKVREA